MQRLVVAAAIVLLVAACAGGGRLSKDEYVQEAREIAQDASVAGELFTRLAAGEVTPKVCRRDTRRFRDEVEAIVDAAGALEPPEEIEPIHDRFVAAGRETVEALDALVDDVRAGRVQCGEEWNSRAYGLASTRRAEEALAELDARGYDVIGD